MSYLVGGATKAAATAVTKTVPKAASIAGSAAEHALDTAGNALSGGLNSFGQLLKDFNVIGFVLGLLIANGVAAIANSFIEGILMPTIQPLLTKITGSGDSSITIGGLTLHLSKFIDALMKFLALAVVIFILMQFGVKMTRPITWVRVEQVNPRVKL